MTTIVVPFELSVDAADDLATLRRLQATRPRPRCAANLVKDTAEYLALGRHKPVLLRRAADHLDVETLWWIDVELARGSADHLVLLDADMTVETDDFELAQLTHDLHDIAVLGGISYRMPYIVRSELPWRYVGRTHEYLTCDVPHDRAVLDTLAVRHHADGGTRHEKFTRDLALLEAAARAEPDDPRTLFYLAQTRQALGDRSGALVAFRRRVELGGWDEEVFWSLYQIGRTLESAGEWVYAAQAYLSAWDHRPHRAEPLFRLAAGYRANDHHHVALLYAECAATIARPRADRLFVEDWIYDWGIDAERSISAWWVGRVEESRRLVEALLARDDLDEGDRTALTQNLELLRRGLAPPGD